MASRSDVKHFEHVTRPRESMAARIAACVSRSVRPCPRTLSAVAGMALADEISAKMTHFSRFLQLARPLLCYGRKDR